MKYFSTLAALVTVIPNIMAMTINTPASVVQCQPQLISWNDGVAPYYLTIIPGGQPSAAPLKTFDPQSGSSCTWLVDMPAGKAITLALKDSTGAMSYTDAVTIQPNNDASCLNGSGGDSKSGNTGNAGSGNSGAGPATQATDATSSVAAGGSTGATGSASTSRPTAAAASSGTSRPASTPSPVSVSAQRTTSAAAAAGTSSSTPASNTSGSESRFSLGGYLVAGALGLVGAVIL